MTALFVRKHSWFVVLLGLCGSAAGINQAAAVDHHVPGRLAPYNNCRLCHGDTLQGGMGRSCYSCHDRVWPGGETPPIADAGGPYSGETGLAVRFNGNGSRDSDGIVVGYAWDFGDGKTATGSRPSHTFTAKGPYTVTLTVTDDNGLTGHSQTLAEVSASTNNTPPFVEIGGPYSGKPGTAIQFDGSASADIDGTIVSYAWQFGDGTVGTGPSPTHAYAAVGIYTVRLVVTDDAGAIDTTSTTVTVSDSGGGGGNQLPVVNLGGPYQGVVGETIQFDASQTVDPDGDPLIFLWNFGDGTMPPLPGASPLASHAYTAAGTYTVQLIVSDGSATPVTGQVSVVISDESDPPPPPPTGDAWALRLPLQQTEAVVTFTELTSGLLQVQTAYSDGHISQGMGLEMQGIILWVEGSGAIFFGQVDRTAGTMMGIVFDDTAGSSVWMAEKL